MYNLIKRAYEHLERNIEYYIVGVSIAALAAIGSVAYLQRTEKNQPKAGIERAVEDNSITLDGSGEVGIRTGNIVHTQEGLGVKTGRIIHTENGPEVDLMDR